MPESPKFVGFYWTLPVHKVGFTAKTEDPLSRSKTLRYQQALVRREASSLKGNVIKEFIFIEKYGDRGSENIEKPFKRAVEFARAHHAQVLYVDFWKSISSRRHEPLYELAKQYLGICRAIDADRIGNEERVIIDGEEFHPAEHFRRWREIKEKLRREKVSSEQLAREIGATVGHLLAPHPAAQDYMNAAEKLNRIGVKTRYGKTWTPENLRAFLRTHGNAPPE